MKERGQGQTLISSRYYRLTRHKALHHKPHQRKRSTRQDPSTRHLGRRTRHLREGRCPGVASREGMVTVTALVERGGRRGPGNLAG